MTTLHAFVQGREFFTGTLADGFHPRLHYITDIDSPYGLYAWCRIRFPQFYHEHEQLLGCTGKQLMGRIWASFLEENGR